NRPAHLRRAMQSERHAVCVHPADHAPEVAYEVGMIREDTRQAAVPLLPDAFHPGIVRLKEFLAPGRTPPGPFRLLEVERWATGEVIDPGAAGQGASFPGWDVLRALGGEIAEVSALTPDEEVAGGVPVLLAGRFERQGLFQVTLVPNQPEARWRLR